jgi:microcystin-dependent protein
MSYVHPNPNDFITLKYKLQENYINAYNSSIINLSNPYNPNDASNKYYVDKHKVPCGTIVPFAGKNVPEFWLLCDGSYIDKTYFSELYTVLGNLYGDTVTTFRIPDLTNKFVFGSMFPNNNTLGGNANVTLTLNELPSHNHTTSMTSNGSHNHTGTTGITGSHDHGGLTNTNGSHTHTHNANGGSGSIGNPVYGLATADGTNTVINTDNSSTEINVWTNPVPLTIDISGSHNHTISLDGNHSHSISSDGLHNHTITMGLTGNGLPFSILPPYIAMNYIIKYV